jgi:hypothetical protein
MSAFPKHPALGHNLPREDVTAQKLKRDRSFIKSSLKKAAELALFCTSQPDGERAAVVERAPQSDPPTV